MRLREAKLNWEMCERRMYASVLADHITEVVPTTHLDPQLFPYRPKISILLQYYQRPDSIRTLVDGYMKCHKEPHKIELLVNVDNVEEHVLWATLAYQTDGFVVPVFSNNIQETRGYNRLAAMARGDLIILVQDDKIPPTSCRVFQDLVLLFEQWPRLGGVGMNLAHRTWDPTQQTKALDAKTVSDFGYMDKDTGAIAQFVMLANFGPYALRRAAYVDVGGLDEGYTEPGQCGIFSDFDLSMRLWSAGYLVLHMYTPQSHMFESDGEVGGSFRGDAYAQCMRKNLKLGRAHFERRFTQEALLAIEQKMNATNLELLVPLDVTKGWK